MLLNIELILFVFIVYTLAADKSLSQWIFVQTERVNIAVRVAWMRLKLHPRNPLTNYLWNRRMTKMIKRMEEENDE